MSELHLFDFDGTLFRSPDRPKWWGPKTWLVDYSSLGPPCVPLKPGSDWWIGKTVSAAKKSISNPNVWSILCTGRHDNGMLRYRIAELLKQKGLNFDEVYLNPTSDTESYKIKVMLKILQKHPHIDTVQIWEDHPGHLPKFVKAIEATGRTCIPHLIKSTKHEVECTQEDMEKMVAEGWSKWRNAMKTAGPAGEAEKKIYAYRSKLFQSLGKIVKSSRIAHEKYDPKLNALFIVWSIEPGSPSEYDTSCAITVDKHGEAVGSNNWDEPFRPPERSRNKWYDPRTLAKVLEKTAKDNSEFDIGYAQYHASSTKVGSKDFKTKDFLKEMKRSIGGDIHRDTLDVWNEEAEQGLIISAEMAPNGVMVGIEIEDYRERQIGRIAIPWAGNMKRFVKEVLDEAKVKRIRLASRRGATKVFKTKDFLKEMQRSIGGDPWLIYQKVEGKFRDTLDVRNKDDEDQAFIISAEMAPNGVVDVEIHNFEYGSGFDHREHLIGRFPIPWDGNMKRFVKDVLNEAKAKRIRLASGATKVAVLHLAKDSKAQEYVKDKAEELKEKGYDDDKAFAVAWSIYCKYKSKEIPDSEGHCQKSPSEYFPNKKKKASPSDVGNRWFSRLGKTAGNIPSKAPREVKQVAKAWEANAMKAAEINIAEDGETGSEARSTMRFWKDRLYVSEMRSDKGPRWLISDNYERASTMVYYPDSDEWYYMPLYGSESLMRGGTREALANAKIFWTG